MAEPVYFTVVADFRAFVEDASTDSDYDMQTVPVGATVTFTPLVSSGDVVLATQASPRPTGYISAPVVGIIDPADGRLKIRKSADAGASGGFGFAPVRLLGSSPLLELDGPLFYTVTFSEVVWANNRRGSINGFTFEAPNSDTELNLITVFRQPGQPASGVTKIAPGAVRTVDGNLLQFSFGGVDIPEAVDIQLDSTGIGDSTTVGRAVITAADQAAARTAIGAENAAMKGASGGYAPLTASGLIDASFLPSYVDDVLSYSAQSAFPAMGETGKIYLAQDTGDAFRWTGSAYLRISDRVTAAGITDSSSVGRAVVTAATELDARTAIGAENAAMKGASGGYAPLDGTAKIDAVYLPSYVDDVLSYADQSAFPVTGETGKIYVALDNNDAFRWTGSAYLRISDRVTAAGITDSTSVGRAVITAADAAAARTAIGAPGLVSAKNVFTGKAEWNPYPFTNPFNSQIYVASLAVDPELMTQGIYVVHRVNGDLNGDASGGVSDTHDAFATEIFATEATNAKYLNALESSCTVDGPTEIFAMCSGLFNGGVTAGSSGTIGEWQILRADQVPPIPAGMTIGKLYSLYVKGQLAGEENYSLYVEGGDSVIAGIIRPITDENFCLRLAPRAGTDATQPLLMVQNYDLSRFLFQARADGTVAVGGDVAGATLSVNNLHNPEKVGLDIRIWNTQTVNPFQVTDSAGAVKAAVDLNGNVITTGYVTSSGTNANLNLKSVGTGKVQANGVEVVTITGNQTLADKTLTSPTLTSPRFNSIIDATNNTVAMAFIGLPSAVNYVVAASTATGVTPELTVAGSDTNISLNLATKGSGTVQANGVQVVDLSTNQTLTGKSISGATNTLSAIPQSAVTDLVTDLSNKQPLDSELTALAGVTSAADALPYFTGSGTAAVTTFTAAGRALVDDADAAAQRTTLGLGSVDNTSDANKPVSTATQTALDGKVPTIRTVNSKALSADVTLTQDDVASGSTNKVFTATEQTKLAGIATGATANSSDATLLARANHTGTQAASTISDFSTAADARITAAVGVSVQAYDADLTAFAGKTAPTGAVVGTSDTQVLGNKSFNTDIGLEKSGQTRIYNTQSGFDSIKLGGAAGIEFETFQAGSAFTTKVKLTAAGDFGIGTTSPAAKLDVNGTVKATSVTLGSATITTGTGSPESVVSAGVGSLYMRTDGGAGTSLYVKESGSGNTGWAAK